MFASFKKLFFKDTEEVLATSIPEPVVFHPAPEWAAENEPSSVTHSSSGSAVGNGSAVEPIAEDDCIALPLDSVFAGLPNSLASFVQSQGSGFVSIPARRILQELPKGSVKVSFGELRSAAPPGTFSENTGHDQVLIELPLNQILMRMPRWLLSRRPDQKQVEVSPEVKDVFSRNGERLSISAPVFNAPKPVQPVVQPTVVTAAVKPAVPFSMPSVAKPSQIKVTLPSSFPAPSEDPKIKIQSPAVSEVQSLKVKIQSSTDSQSATPTLNLERGTLKSELPVPFRVLPDQRGGENGNHVSIRLGVLCKNWPEMVQREISGGNLNGATVALPMDKLEEGLRTGKLVFTWKQICGWIEPRVNYRSEIEETPLELPLNTVAPLFMAKHKSGKVQKQIFIGEVPDLFEGKKPRIDLATPTVATPRPGEIQMVPRLSMAEPVEAAPMAQTDEKPIVLETAPAITAQHDLSPHDIVKSLAAQPEIAGAFIAMQDGLLVAAELPSHLKADTVAAFLPQIFGRMNQYTKELQLGAVSSLTFVVENVTWQIVKSGTVYLVALGKPGESWPAAKLNTLAAQLSRQIN